MKEFDIYIDGASKGNPGHAGIGAIICQGQAVLKNISCYIGKATNNFAEYTALIYALEEALILKAKSLKIYTDSQLLSRQMNKEYKVKHPNIIILHQRAMHLVSAFEKVDIVHLPREKNRGADKLANRAIKKAISRVTDL